MAYVMSVITDTHIQIIGRLLKGFDLGFLQLLTLALDL